MTGCFTAVSQTYSMPAGFSAWEAASAPIDITGTLVSLETADGASMTGTLINRGSMAVFETQDTASFVGGNAKGFSNGFSNGFAALPVILDSNGLPIKVFVGGVWVTCKAKTWDGSAWQEAKAKIWDGNAFS